VSNQEEPTPSDVDRLVAENQALRTALDRRMTWRKVLTALLVVLTTLSTVATAIAVWAHQTVFDTGRFMATIGPVLDDPVFYTALGDRASAETLEALDLETRVTTALASLDAFLSEALLDALDLDERARELLDRFERPSLTALAPPIVEGLEARVDRAIHAFFESEGLRSRLPGVVERAHEVTVALIRGETAEVPNVYIESGEVRWNTIPLVVEALRAVADEISELLPDFDLPDVISDRLEEGREQLAEAIQAELPEDFGQVTIMSEDSLTELQTAAVTLDRMVWGLLILTVVLAGVTIAVSPARRRTGVQLGIGIAIAFVIALVVLRRVETAILAEIANPNGERAARLIFGEVFSGLRYLIRWVTLAAVVVALGAYLAGRPRWLRSVTEGWARVTTQGADGSPLDRWVVAHYDLLRLGAIGLAVLVLFLTGLGLWQVLVVGAFLGAYLWGLTTVKARHDQMKPEPAGVGAQGEMNGNNQAD
jgi:hypothetical protein